MVYGIYSVEVDRRGYIQDPPGRHIEVEYPLSYKVIEYIK